MRKLLFFPTAFAPGRNAATMTNAIRVLLFVLLLFPAFMLPGIVKSQVSITSGSLTYTQNFNTYTGASATAVPAGWSASCPNFRGVGNGSSNTGGAWAYGTSAAEVCLGYLGSGTSSSCTYAVSFVNNTGSPITALTINFNAEQWRWGGGNSNGFSCSATGALSASVSALSTSSAPSGGSAGTVQTTPRSLSLTGLSIANGATFGFSWTAVDGSGSDNSIGIDDFSMTAVAIPVPAIALSSPAQVPAGFVSQGSNDNPLFAFQAAVTSVNATLNTVNFTTTGTYASTDLVKYKLYYNTTNNFATAAQIGTDITTSLGVGAHSFTALGQAMNIGTTGYFWITADINAAAILGKTLTVSAITPANLVFAAGNVTGTTTVGGVQTIAPIPGMSTITNSNGASLISSLANTQATGVQVLTFTFTDDGTTPAHDVLESKISNIVIRSGAGFNPVSNWTQAILGAELSDGTSSVMATAINSTDITFSGIPNAVLGDLGFVGDDSSKNYTLKVWLNPSLGGTLPSTIDNMNFIFTAGILDFTITGSQLGITQSANSGFANNIVDVTATKISIVTQPPALTDVNLAMTPAVTYAATDVNGNRDLDNIASIDITSTGTLAATSTNTAVAVAGLATFNNIKHSVPGTGLVLNATSTGLAAAPASNTFIIYNSGDHFRSAGTVAGAWNLPSTWESSEDSTIWVPAVVAPGINAASINILPGDTVNITTAVSFDNTTIKSGAVLSIQSASTAYTVNDGAGDDLTIENGGILQIKAQTVSVGGTGMFRVKTGGTIVAAHTAANNTFPSYYLASTLTRVVYEDSSIFEVNSPFITSMSAVSYFNTGVNDMPILRITNTGASLTISTSAAISINGRIEANKNITFSSTGVKTIRGGIIGTGIITQSAATGGGFVFESPNAVLGGTIKMTLAGTGTTGGLTILNGLMIPANANVGINGAATIRVAKAAGALTINGILDLGTSVFSDLAGGTILNGTLKTANPNGFTGGTVTAYVPAAGSSIAINPGSKVDYTATGTQTITGANYDTLTNTGNGARTLAANQNIRVASVFSPGNGAYTGGVNDTVTFTGTNQNIPTINYFTLDLSGATTPVIGSVTTGVAGTFIPGAGLTSVSQGTFNFNGTTLQTIPAFGFNNLAIANAASANVSAGVIVTANTTFTNGDLRTNRPTPVAGAIVLTDTATATGSSDASHVDGYVTKAGDDAFTFPTGNGTDLRTLAVTAPAAATDTFSVAYWSTSANTNADNTGGPYSFASKQAGILKINPNFYWDFVTVSGTSSLTVTLSLPSLTSFAASDTDVQMLGWNTVTSNWELLATGSNGLTEGSTIAATVSNASIYSAFAIGSEKNTVELTAIALLQGPFSQGTQLMNATMNLNGVLEANVLGQPYNVAPFNYGGSEAVATGFFTAHPNIVDWVLVDLRDTTDPNIVVARRAAFITTNGVIVDTNGTTAVQFSNINNGYYHIAIQHRNHLAIRTATPVAFLNGDDSVAYDFTTLQPQAYQNPAITGNAAMTALPGGSKFGMWAGNTNGNTSVRASGPTALNDVLQIINNALSGNTATILTPTYSNADVTMDGTARASGPNAINDALFIINNTLSGNNSTIINQH